MRILFAHSRRWPYVERDLSILSERHEVRERCFQSVGDLPALLSGVLWSQATFSWFGKVHAFVAVAAARALGKRSAVVAGGDDVACEPEMGYGMHSHWWKRWCPLAVFRLADLVLAVSQFNRYEAITNARANPAKTRLVYHGFDWAKYRRAPGVGRDSLVMTLGTLNREYVARKGIGLFVEAAALLPTVRFAVAGQAGDALPSLLHEVSPNVEFAGRVSDEQLIALYSSAHAYVQPSLHEAFGCAVAESMLCECIPVVSRRAALPEVVGDTGVYVDGLTGQGLADGIREALALGPEWGHKARERIVDLFPLEKRRDALLAAVDEVMGS